MRTRVVALAAVVALLAAIFVASLTHHSSTTLADQLCLGLTGSPDSGLCLPTPH